MAQKSISKKAQKEDEDFTIRLKTPKIMTKRLKLDNKRIFTQKSPKPPQPKIPKNQLNRLFILLFLPPEPRLGSPVCQKHDKPENQTKNRKNEGDGVHHKIQHEPKKVKKVAKNSTKSLHIELPVHVVEKKEHCGQSRHHKPYHLRRLF